MRLRLEWELRLGGSERSTLLQIGVGCAGGFRKRASERLRCGGFRDVAGAVGVGLAARCCGPRRANSLRGGLWNRQLQVLHFCLEVNWCGSLCRASDSF